MALMRYDELSGQVYEETIVPVTSMVSMSTWMNRCNGRREDLRKYRHRERGSPSLYQMAMRTCLYNIDSMSSEHLEAAEWPYAERIYQYLQKNQLLTANIWAMYQKAFPGKKALNSYPIRIPSYHAAPAELHFIPQWLDALPFYHLSFLNIQGLRICLKDLFCLLKFPNLGVVLMRHTYEAKDDSLCDKDMRNWGREVQRMEAFKNLKVVAFHHFIPSLVSTLKCFAKFPALSICSVEPYRQLSSMGHAADDIWRASLPFSLAPKAIADQTADIWSGPPTSSLAKMKLLYDLAEKWQPEAHRPSIAKEPDPAIFSVHYGSERSFSYSAFPIWFIRDWLSSRYKPEEQAKRAGEGEGNESKKRKIRTGKQSNIGSFLETFN